MAVFPEAVGHGYAAAHPNIAPVIISGSYRHPRVDGAQRTVLAYMVFKIWAGAELEWIPRGITYEGVAMDRGPAVEFGNNAEWLEAYSLRDAPAGGKVDWSMGGYLLAPKWAHVNTISYTGCDDDDPPTWVTTTGTGTTLTAAALNAPAAGKAVQAFGSRTGLKDFSDNSQYLSNAGISLMFGDADGTGSPKVLTAARANSGAWGGIGCVLTPADVVGTPNPIWSRSRVGVLGRRLPRPGVYPRRHVIDVKLEA